MAETLRMADEKQAYTLSDRATFLARGDNLQLVIHCEGDLLLLNRYSVFVVNSRKHPHVHVEAARRFADFLTSPPAIQVIREFGVDKFGEPLFSVQKGLE
jgi:tungstate transport system substrate-binding protein